jgi:hypothetical protein
MKSLKKVKFPLLVVVVVLAVAVTFLFNFKTTEANYFPMDFLPVDLQQEEGVAQVDSSRIMSWDLPDTDMSIITGVTDVDDFPIGWNAQDFAEFDSKGMENYPYYYQDGKKKLELRINYSETRGFEVKEYQSTYYEGEDYYLWVETWTVSYRDDNNILRNIEIYYPRPSKSSEEEFIIIMDEKVNEVFQLPEIG